MRLYGGFLVVWWFLVVGFGCLLLCGWGGLLVVVRAIGL
jgi:hypothetical protein